MKIVLTGGSGFFGSHLARALPEHEVVLFDLHPLPAGEEIANTETVLGDVRDPSAVFAVCQGADAIVHAAAALPLCPAHEIRAVNVGGAEHVFKTAVELKIQRVVLMSSTAVYGIPKQHPLLETNALQGVGVYGQSKVDAETLAEKYRERGLCIPILRPKTFLGPERMGVFQILYDWIREGRRIPVLGSGQNRYQLLDVEDAALAARTLLEAPAESANANFHCGAEKFASVAEDLGRLFAHAGTGSRIFPIPALPAKAVLGLLSALHLSPLYRWIWATADRDSFVDNRRLLDLGWQPHWSNSDSLIRAWDWYQNAQPNVLPGSRHRTPWRQGALRLVRHFF